MPLLAISLSTSACVSAMRRGAFSGVRSSSCSVTKGTSLEVRERRATNFPVATVLGKPAPAGAFDKTVTKQTSRCLKALHSERVRGFAAWCHQPGRSVWQAYHAVVLPPLPPEGIQFPSPRECVGDARQGSRAQRRGRLRGAGAAAARDGGAP